MNIDQDGHDATSKVHPKGIDELRERAGSPAFRIPSIRVRPPEEDRLKGVVGSLKRRR